MPRVLLDAVNRMELSIVRNLLLALSLILLGGCYSGDNQATKNAPPAVSEKENTQQKLQQAHALVRQGDPKQALAVLRQVLLTSPDDPQALGLAIQIQRSLGKYCEAAELAAKVSTSDRKLAGMAIQAFELYLRCGDFPKAEQSLRGLLTTSPNHIEAHRLLAQLLNAQGRRMEASEHVRQLLRMRSVQPIEILSLIDLSGPFLLVSYQGVVDESIPSLFQLGNARQQYASRADPEEVLATVQKIREQFPESQAAAAFQGHVFAELGKTEELRRWLGELPQGIVDEPEYWYALGRLLASEQRHPQAIRACAEAVRLDPTNRESIRAMISSLDSIGKEAEADKLRKTLSDLDKIFRIARESDAEQAMWISQKMQDLVRPWESAAWLMKSSQQSGQLAQRIPELNQRQAAILKWEEGSTIEQIRAARLKQMLGFRAEDWPLPDVGSLRKSTSQTTIVKNSGLQFDDVAGQLGLVSQLASGFPLGGGDYFIYHPNGSGLAVIDYDLDGYCDIYAAHSGGKPNDPVGSSPNQLFRFLPKDQFSEIAAICGTDDRGFGQGVCVGDANQDGFPDLLVANIGKNLLYINNGDGTFRNASELIADNGDQWTSTMGLADLSGDHLPEIIEVTYIDDPQAYKTACPDDYNLCQPQRFNKSADRVLTGNQDGSFSPWTPICQAMREQPNLGFGLIIANFDRQAGNDFFVTNDGDFNDYYISRPADESAGTSYQVVETGNLAGCSIGRGGDSQACMGVASGDFDRNGTLDLHVTNFRKEAVNLFMQTLSGNFSDKAMAFGLFEPSFPVLGWGTQAADFDNSGWLDLAVINGHVFDDSDKGIPFEMEPQLFLGGERGFVTHDASAGEYWNRKYVGRSLATLDYNRDGRIDLIANHIDVPTALLRNDSVAENWLQLELIGTTSERDAIGATVMVEVGDQQWTCWQTGGDGHMSSNEPVIHVGLGSVASIDRVTISWPSGKTQEFKDVASDTRYLLVEGQQLYRRWPQR